MHHVTGSLSVPAIDLVPTGRVAYAAAPQHHAERAQSGPDLDAPAFTPEGQPTPEGRAAFDETADRLLAEAARTADPRATLDRIVEVLPEIASESADKVFGCDEDPVRADRIDRFVSEVLAALREARP